MQDQPFFRFFSLLIVALIKSVTVFFAFILFTMILFDFPEPVQGLGDVLDTVGEQVSETVAALPEVLGSSEEPETDAAGQIDILPTPSYDDYVDPEGCLKPDDDYELVTVNTWQINKRTMSMLEYAQSIYEGVLELTGPNLIHGSYDTRGAMQDTAFSGGGAVGFSVLNVQTGELLTTDVQPLIHALRTAGFAAWLRGVDEVYPGSPMMIEAIAIGDQDLNEMSNAKVFGEFGYFSMKNGLTGDFSMPDSHGGPVVCRWMLEAGFGGAAVTEEEPVMVGSTFADENHGAQLDVDSVNRDAGQLRLVPDPLAFPVSGYSGPTSFRCMAPSDVAVLSGLFGEVRGEFIHAGIDYSQCSRVGYAVYTPMGGQVVFAGEHELYGFVFVIENNGWQVLMAHNLALLVKEGDIVEAGQVVALSGSSGNSGGPHIHFEIRYCEDGTHCRPMNPSEVLIPGQNELCPWEELGQAECPPGM